MAASTARASSSATRQPHPEGRAGSRRGRWVDTRASWNAPDASRIPTGYPMGYPLGGAAEAAYRSSAPLTPPPSGTRLGRSSFAPERGVSPDALPVHLGSPPAAQELRRAHTRDPCMMEPSSTRIHPTALISAQAELAPDVTVGAFAVLEGPVRLGPGCVIGPRAHLI